MPEEIQNKVRRNNKFLLVALVAMLGLSTAFFRLGSKGLWGDEVWQVYWSQQQSFWQTLARFTIFNEANSLRHLSDSKLPVLVTSVDNYPLHFLWTHLTTKLGTSEFWARFPSAFLGAASVLIMFLLGRKLFGQRAGLTAAVLMALAPYHVWYAQDARPYSALVFYSLLSLYFFAEILERPSWKAWLGFVLATTLNFYNHMLASLPFITELMVSAGIGIIWWLRARSTKLQTDVSERHKIRRSLWMAWSGLFVAAVIALPVLAKAIILIKLQGLVPGQNTRFQLTSQFLGSLFSSFGAGNGTLLWAFILLSIIGLGTALFRRPWFGILTLVWIAFPLVSLGIMQPRRVVPLRYLLFIQPLYLLTIALGCHRVIEALGRLKDIVLPKMSLGSKVWSWMPTGIVVSVIFFTVFPLTWKGYRVEKINDWSGLCSYLHCRVEQGDIIVGEDYASYVMDWSYRKRNGVALVRPDRYSLDELRDMGRNVWYLALDDHPPYTRAAFLQRNFEETPKSAYAKSDLLPPDYNCGGRIFFPNFELPVRLYSHKAAFAPSLIEFKDWPGSKNWPNYVLIEPRDHYDVVLRLPAAASRILLITMWDFVERDLVLYLNDRLIGAIKAGKSGGRWVTFRFPLSPSDPDTFLLKMMNPGSKVSCVSRVEVQYAQ